ncbi:MAG: LPS-assembly protein LptD [Bacteroidales bacterium]|nr:LPS-assembly protein LptD [Bacteroidales bacterium]
MIYTCIRIALVGLCIVFSSCFHVIVAQENDSTFVEKKQRRITGATIIPPDTTSNTHEFNKGDSTFVSDSSFKKDVFLNISKDAITSAVDYYAEDSIVFDMREKKSYLYHLVNVKYEDINLTSHFMEIDFSNNELYACGIKDSLEKLQGNPVFNQNQTEFKAHEIKYNFNSKKGLISNVITEESDGFLHGQLVKKIDDNTNYVYKGSFTTCNLEHPHFGFNFKKAKVIANDKIVTGPIQLHVMNIPTPLVAPFALIPNQKGHRNGILIPAYGESMELGFYFRGLGVYFAFNDMIDLALTADIYTRGSFGVNVKSNYVKRYKFSGHIDASYSNTRSGEPTTPSYSVSNDFKINWRHTQDPKAHPRNRFSADVNFLTSNYNKRNIVDVNDYVNTNFTSAVSFSTSWRNHYSLGVNADLSQNIQTKTMQLTLPNINFNISQFYPFRRKNVVGKLRWYENISMSYNTILVNSITLSDTLNLSEQIPNNMKYGISHSIPISSTIKVLKHLDWNNTINLNEYWQFRGALRSWSQDTNGNSVISRDTVYGFFAIHNIAYSSTLRTTLYGMYSMKKGRVKAFRHEFVPALAFHYSPAINKNYFKSYVDGKENEVKTYSPTEGFLYGTPVEKDLAYLSLTFNNKLEMKVANKKDSTGSGSKKVVLIENISIGSRYIITADSMQWQPLAITGRTTVYKALVLSFGAGLDPYIIGTSGVRVDTFELAVNQRLFRLSNSSFAAALTYSINNQTFKKKGDKKEKEGFSALRDWRVDINYIFNYNLVDNYAFYKLSNPDSNQYNNTITNTVNINGNFQLTEKWRVSFTTGYDFTNKNISVSSFDIYRDLHCWEMGFKWRPFGSYRGFEFVINVKSGLLKDLKYNLDKDYRDFN